MSVDAPSSALIPAGSSAQQQPRLPGELYDRIGPVTWVSTCPHMSGVPSELLEEIFSNFSLPQLPSMKRANRELYKTIIDYAAWYLTQNKFSAAKLEKLTAVFQQLQPKRYWWRLENTSEVLARIPAGIRASLTYLDCHDNDQGLVAAAQCVSLRTIDLRLSLWHHHISVAAFNIFLQGFQGRPLEIVLLDKLVNLAQLEKVREIVSPESHENDFSGIPLHYMKDIRKITIGPSYDLDRWTDEDTNRELEKFRTLPEETRRQITSLNLSVGTITPLTLHGFFALLPNLGTVDLLSATIDQDILNAIRATGNIKEAYLRIFPGVNYDLARDDLRIHCVRSHRNLDLDNDGGARMKHTTKFTSELLETAEAVFLQEDPNYVDLAPLERYLQKLNDLEFYLNFDERQLLSLLTLPLEVRKNVKEIRISNAASLDILRRQAFPELERLEVGLSGNQGVSFAEVRDIVYANCPNLRYWIVNADLH